MCLLMIVKEVIYTFRLCFDKIFVIRVFKLPSVDQFCFCVMVTPNVFNPERYDHLGVTESARRRPTAFCNILSNSSASGLSFDLDYQVSNFIANDMALYTLWNIGGQEGGVSVNDTYIKGS